MRSVPARILWAVLAIAAPGPATGQPTSESTAEPDDAFADAMTEGLRALEEEDWERARRAFERALELDPDAPGAADGLARAKAGATEEAVHIGLERARALEADERWRQAAEAYAAVLELEPTIRTARDGLARSEERAGLLEAVAYHLRHPKRLASDPVLAEARALAEDARDVAAEGSRLARRADELARLVRDWSRPVTVRLVSDGATDVTIYRVRSLGSFDSRTLELAPGTYTVVGSRRGYRDVRRELVVEPGEEPPPLTIACEERI